MITKIHTLIYYFFIAILFLACGQIDTQRQSDTLKKEMKAKKLKRLTDGQIQTAAFEEGKSIALRLEGILLNLADTNSFDCEEAKNIQFQNEVLVSFKLFCQPSSDMNEKEKQIWEAYQNSLSQKLPLSDNLQKLGETAFLYSAPLYIKNQYQGLWSIVLSKKEIVRKM